MNNLRNNGYIIIKNKSNNKKFDISLANFYKKDIINYIKLKDFIDKQYFPKLTSFLDIHEKPYYNKFNFNNNLITDSAFYGDIYNHTNDNILNIYTCLYYFDDAYLEIIPQSHKKDNYVTNTYSTSYRNKEKILIKKDSFLLFHANIHYRCIALPNVKNTKILKIYNVCFTKKEYDYYIPKIIIVKTHNSIFLKYITKLCNNLHANDSYNIIPYFHYFFIYYDLQYKFISMVDLSPYNKKNKILSYNSSNNELDIERCDKNRNTNINIKCDKNIKSCGPGNFYICCYIVYWTITLLILYFLYENKK